MGGVDGRGGRGERGSKRGDTGSGAASESDSSSTSSSVPESPSIQLQCAGSPQGGGGWGDCFRNEPSIDVAAVTKDVFRRYRKDGGGMPEDSSSLEILSMSDVSG